MIFYKVTWIDGECGHLIEWTDTKEKAEAIVKKVREEGDEDVYSLDTERIVVPSTKKEMLRFLEDHASHPDNG